MEEAVQFIADYWWLWLIIIVMSGSYATYAQLRRMRLIENSLSDAKPNKEVWKILVADFIAGGSWILLFISIVLHIKHFKA
jgi:hypothetical protein